MSEKGRFPFEQNSGKSVGGIEYTIREIFGEKFSQVKSRKSLLFRDTNHSTAIAGNSAKKKMNGIGISGNLGILREVALTGILFRMKSPLPTLQKSTGFLNLSELTRSF